MKGINNKNHIAVPKELFKHLYNVARWPEHYKGRGGDYDKYRDDVIKKAEVIFKRISNQSTQKPPNP